MMKIGTVKKTAYGCLKKCWAESAFISMLNAGIFCAVYILVFLIARFTGAHNYDTVMPAFSELPPRFLIAVLIVLTCAYIACAPLYFGVRWFYWQAAEGQIMPLSSLFACYSSSETIFRCIKLKFSTDIRKFILACAFGTLALLEFFLARQVWDYSGQSKAAGIALISGCVVVTVGIEVIYSVLTMKYIPVGYLMADSPYSGTREILDMSRSIVSKKYTYMCIMYFSCIGWIASCFFVFPVLVVQPIMHMITAVFIRDSLKSADTASSDDSGSTAEDADITGKERQLV